MPQMKIIRNDVAQAAAAKLKWDFDASNAKLRADLEALSGRKAPSTPVEKREVFRDTGGKEGCCSCASACSPLVSAGHAHIRMRSYCWSGDSYRTVRQELEPSRSSSVRRKRCRGLPAPGNDETHECHPRCVYKPLVLSHRHGSIASRYGTLRQPFASTEPRDRTAAASCSDDFTPCATRPHHSITWSARLSSVGGTLGAELRRSL